MGSPSNAAPLSTASPAPAERAGLGAAPRIVLVLLGTWGTYLLAGWAALLLAGGPGVAAPLFPPAGIALVAVLRFGRVALVGVWLGSMTLNLLAGAQAPAGPWGWALAPLIGLGALAQAWLGAALVHRFVGTPLLLHAPRDILRAGALGALVACAVSASVATLSLWALGVLSAAEAPGNWATWWLGDALGVLVAAPLALTLVGRPALDWQRRRYTVGVPLLIALALLVAVIHEARQLESAGQRAQFERDAERLAADARTRLGAPIHALQAVHGAVLATGGQVGAGTLGAAAAWWLTQPLPLRAVGYSERVPAGRLAGWLSEQQREEPTFRVFQRDQGQALERDGEAVVLRRIEPRSDNAAALGVNALSIPAARAAILAAAGSGAVAATSGFVLTQGSSTGETGIVLYRAMYRGPDATDEQRQRHWSGVVFVTVSLDRALAGLGGSSGNGAKRLRWCLIEPAADSRRRLAGTPGCERALPAAEFVATHAIVLADRRFELRLSADPRTLPGAGREQSVLIGLAGMASAALLGALLLVITGHSRRIEGEVLQATAELRHEIDERNQAEAALRDREQLLRTILAHVPIGVLFLSPKGRVIEANAQVETLFGLPLAALREHPAGQLVDPADHPRVMAEQQAMLEGRASSSRGRYTLRRADASAFTAIVAAVPLRDVHGRVHRFVAVVEDITEQLRLQASEQELHRVEAASRAKSEFLSRMSHELRTPLNAMIGFAQLLGLDRNPPLAATQADWAQQIQRAGWHLLEMINDTLDLARIESGSVRLDLAPVSLAPLLAGCRMLLEGAAAAREIRILEQVQPGAERVLADPTRLKQIVTNLLSNAIKYNHPGGAVRLLARPMGGGQVALQVHDTGPGLTTEQLAHLFEPYNRLGRERGTVEGTGIGLVISRRLAELMGGSLEAASQPGEGAVFTLLLPGAEAAQTLLAGVEPEPGPAAYQRRHVHYVEDNETNIEVMRGILLQRPQIELGVSTLGLDALDALRRAPPQLILLDMQLPDISGLELLRHLKADPALAGIPVIVVSADATTRRIEEALTLGAAHYVTKPIEIGRFLGLVDELLESQDTRWM
jgi:PAS domain S-box-containing protein